MYWNDVVFPFFFPFSLFVLLSSLRAWLCKSLTKLPLDFCVTKSRLIEFPVYISNLVGYSCHATCKCFQYWLHAFKKKVIVLLGSSNNHECIMNQDGKHEGNVLLKDKKIHNFGSTSQMTHPKKEHHFSNVGMAACRFPCGSPDAH